LPTIHRSSEENSVQLKTLYEKKHTPVNLGRCPTNKRAQQRWTSGHVVCPSLPVSGKRKHHQLQAKTETREVWMNGTQTGNLFVVQLLHRRNSRLQLRASAVIINTDESMIARSVVNGTLSLIEP